MPNEETTTRVRETETQVEQTKQPSTREQAEPQSPSTRPAEKQSGETEHLRQ